MLTLNDCEQTELKCGLKRIGKPELFADMCNWCEKHAVYLLASVGWCVGDEPDTVHLSFGELYDKYINSSDLTATNS